jgi:hypothetical protein
VGVFDLGGLPVTRSTDDWERRLDELRAHPSGKEISAADLFWGIEVARHKTAERRYGQAVTLIDGLAHVYPRDVWLQDLREEATTLLVTAEECVSRAEILESQARFSDAYAAYMEGVNAYDRHPGVWPLVFYFLSGWMLDVQLRRGDKGDTAAEPDETEVETRHLESLRKDVLARMSQRDQRMSFESRLGAFMSVTMDEPWPDVVKAFCDSRPAARVIVDRKDNRPISGAVSRSVRTAADAIRVSRPEHELWELRNIVSLASPPYTLTVSSNGEEATLEIEPSERMSRLEDQIISFLKKRWPSSAPSVTQPEG